MKQLGRLIGTTALLLTMTVLAEAANPIFHLDDPPVGQPVPGLSFEFFSNQAGGGFFAFTNESGFDWLDLNVQVIQPSNTNITCTAAVFFSTCLVSPIASDTPLPPGSTLYNLNLSSVLKQGGIANGDVFTINLNNLVEGTQPDDPESSGDWGANVRFSARVNASLTSTPEPQTWALMAAGMLFIGSSVRLMRRRRAN